ncbi:MAG TPA: twin-arginine translocase TatA/TatE family subunit [Candidatus Sumerlaeota bacterium]|nr:twin-arginine translocase TatA/TatE family subunit [Candidatus Sumerlaeota bacterium]HMZ52223.1 twin-arginine translocase TatA/TatE family subunit [Candidatus Sumerlaeota bacterium]HNM46054.1 twin-arginine translocase TatA/TatE family subunit [Candidatus Sumerlaeota bacterium]
MTSQLAAGIFGLGPLELIVILAVVLLIFGPSQIPKLGKMFGQSMRDFRDASKKLDDEEEDRRVADDRRASASRSSSASRDRQE